MGEKKQIAYYYDHVLKLQDIVVDVDGSAHVPEKDQIIVRRAARWKVRAVIKDIGSGRNSRFTRCIWSRRIPQLRSEVN
jgi:hypothetical protein